MFKCVTTIFLGKTSNTICCSSRSMDDRRRGNGARLSRLLIDKGTEAMRNVFDNIHPPSKLTAVLNSHKIFLKNLRCINRIQFRILFPPDGTASKSEDFDITLLFNLLRHISGLRPPSSTGSWDKNPPSTDTSVEANLARIKYYRNVVYGHITSTGIDDANFQSHWNSISTALIYLGVSSGDIELLRFAPLEENCYLNLIHEWKEKEDKLETILQNHTAKLDTIPNRLDKIEEVLKEGRKEVKNAVESGGANDFQAQKEILNQMAKCNFDGNIKNLSQAFHEGTRQWLFVKLDRWFSGRDPDPRVMILTAGPGVGKSVFAGKVCQMYKDLRQLAACHFCKFNYSDYRNPQILFESLSSHMCQNIPGFRGKLIEQLRRNHSRDTITDAFRVLLNDPLHAIEERDPMMIVIDGLDESETRGKSELLDLIAKEFPKLPSWIKIFITSRPELSVRKKLSHLNPIEIEAGGKNNDQDVKHFLASCLENCNLREDVLNRLVYQCDGSFLFAHHIVSSISRQVQNRSLTLLNVKHFTPKSIGSVYEEYFDRLKKEIEVLRDEKSSGMKFESILEILAAARGPIPLTFVAEALELSTDTRAMKEVIRKVNDRLSALLLAYDDCLTVFHKTVVDWLLSRGYDEHSYTVDSVPGHKLLWLACRKEYEKLKGNAQCEERTKAQEYASQYGMNHLEWISNFHAQIQSKFLVNSYFCCQGRFTQCFFCVYLRCAGRHRLLLRKVSLLIVTLGISQNSETSTTKRLMAAKSFLLNRVSNISWSCSLSISETNSFASQQN